MAYVQEILNKVQEIRETDGDDKKTAHTRMRSAISGGVIGGIVGLMVGYSKKWNLLYSVIGGAMIGSLVAGIFTPKDPKE